LDRSTLHSSINDRGGVGFFRDHSRPSPYNLVSDLAKVSAAIKGDGVRNVGFTWAAADPARAAFLCASSCDFTDEAALFAVGEALTSAPAR